METLRAILSVLYQVMNVYFYIMIATIILSWTPLTNTKFFMVLKIITDPYLNLFRGFIVLSNIDFTPIVGIFLYELLLRLMLSVI
jgi:uncharacterized protein YggT (Ycf19 family)